MGCLSGTLAKVAPAQQRHDAQEGGSDAHDASRSFEADARKRTRKVPCHRVLIWGGGAGGIIPTLEEREATSGTSGARQTATRARETIISLDLMKFSFNLTTPDYVGLPQFNRCPAIDWIKGDCF